MDILATLISETSGGENHATMTVAPKTTEVTPQETLRRLKMDEEDIVCDTSRSSILEKSGNALMDFKKSECKVEDIDESLDKEN